MGVDISQSSNSTPESAQNEDPTKPPIEQPKRVTDQSFEGADRKSKWYGFPIKDNIYTGQVQFNIDEQPVTFDVVVNRQFVKNRRHIPSYAFALSDGDTAIGDVREPAPGTWGSYNEDQYILDLPILLQNKFGMKEKSKIYLAYKQHVRMSQRSPELIDFLKNLETTPITIQIHINDERYQGDYPAVITKPEYSYSITAKSALQHQHAPYPVTLIYERIPSKLNTPESFNQWLEQLLTEDKDRMAEQYLEYLQSFPYLAQEQETDAMEMREILPLIQSQSMDMEYFKSKLIAHGYVRPTKRQKRNGPGMVPQDAIEYIIDHKKAIMDVFYQKNRRLTTSPTYLFAVIAYLMHGYRTGTVGWMSLGDGIRHFNDTLNRHGAKMDYLLLHKYIGKVATSLLQYITGEQVNDYDNGATQNQQTGGLNAFVAFAVQLGVNQETARTNPKTVYRQLVMQHHPDQNPGADPEIIRRLNALYESVPMELKANTKLVNWFQKQAFPINF